MKYIRQLNAKYSLLGAWLYISSIQYFIVQLVVATRWSTRYSLRSNTISDLGNTACGTYNGRYICSPLHPLMNVSFVVLGLTMFVGSLLVYTYFKRTNSTRLGFGALALAGFGTIIVGLFPENTLTFVHGFGAFLPFFVGNIGIVVLGCSNSLPKSMRIISLLFGVGALVALALFVTGNFLTLGEGGMERVVAYPQTLWLIIVGGYCVRQHRRTQ